MAEEFNPTTFRQQMAQQASKIPAAVDAPQLPPVQQQVPSQPYAPPAGHAPQPQQGVAPVPQQHVPQQHVPQQHVPQQHVPQQHVPQQHAPQPRAPQQHAPQHYNTQQYQAVPYQAQTQAPVPAPAPAQQGRPSQPPQQNFQPQLQQQYAQQPQMPELMSGQIGAEMKAMPMAKEISRPIVFVAGLALGVLGMTIANMLFSGGDTPPINAISSVSDLASEMPEGVLDEMSEGKTKMMALTDEMLLDN